MNRNLSFGVTNTFCYCEFVIPALLICPAYQVVHIVAPRYCTQLFFSLYTHNTTLN